MNKDLIQETWCKDAETALQFANEWCAGNTVDSGECTLYPAKGNEEINNEDSE